MPEETKSITEWAEEDGIQVRFTKIPCATQPGEYLVVEILDAAGCEIGKEQIAARATFVQFRAARIAEFLDSLERRRE